MEHHVNTCETLSLHIRCTKATQKSCFFMCKLLWMSCSDTFA